MDSVGHTRERATRAAAPRGFAHALSRGLRPRAKPASLSPSPRLAARIAGARRAACCALAVGLALLFGLGSVAAEDTLPTVSVSDAQVSEDRTWMRFEVSLSKPSHEQVTVHFATRDGTATSGTDFRAVSRTLTFPANSRSPQRKSVLVYDDQVPEPDETFTVTLTNPTGATLGDATATGTIKDDGDTAATLTPSDIEDTTATLTINGHTESWWYRRQGSDSQWGACTAVTAGTTVVSISGLTALTDYEYWAYSDSTCKTKLARVEFRTIAPDGTPTVSVSDAQVTEDRTRMRFEVSLSQPSREEVRVYYRTSDGTATSGTDFRAESGGYVPFPANSSEITRSASVTVYDDQEPEPDETFTVTLTNARNATLGDATATGTIKDDGDTAATLTPSDIEDTTATLTISGHTDGWWYRGQNRATAQWGACTAVTAGTTVVSISGLTTMTRYEYWAYSDSTCKTKLANVEVRTLAPEGTPTVSVSDAQVSEDGGKMRFEVSLSQPSRAEVTVHFATRGGTATSGTDFRAESGWGYLSFGANSSVITRYYSVKVYDDQEPEPDETFTLTLTNAKNATLGDATATGTIKNDGDTAATLTPSDIEDTTATLTISGHTDGWWYRRQNRATAQWAACTAVTAGTTAVSISGLTAVTRYEYWAYSDSTCTTKLANVEFRTLAPEGTPTVSVSDAQVSEDGTWMAFEVSLSQPSRKEVGVYFHTSDGTATGGTDFRAESGGYVPFSANSSETTMHALVIVYDDQEPESDETFTVTLTNARNATLGDTTTATGTIEDDGDTAATLTPSDIEDTTATLTISGHTDGWWYKGNEHPCTAVTAGTTAVSISGLTAVTTYEYWAYSDSTCTTKLANVEFRTLAPEGTPTVSVSDAQVSEDGGRMAFEVSLSAPSRDEVTVGYATASGTATSGTDFGVASGTLTFPPNSDSSQIVPVLVHDDSESEPDETFTLTLTNPTGATLGDAVATGTIEDDEESIKLLTAEFRDVPDEHEGKGSEFSFELRFSENFAGRLPYKKLRDEALRTTNGQVTGARRAVHGQNQRWIITVRAQSSDDVTVTLPAAEDCAATGAICTEAGRKLSNTTSATIATESGDTGPARFVSAATEPQGRGLWLTFTKDIWVAGLHTDYTVLVGGERRATRAASWEDNRVALVLTEPVRAGETVTVAYAKPSDGVKLHDTDELAVESFGPEAVENTLVQAANEPATGAPSISGAAQVGGTLMASTAEIADADGMTGAAFAFQWVSNDGSADSDIAGATGSSYTLAAADQGRRIKVRVTFTDDAGHAETLVSAATAAVAARPLTASFTGVPAEHDGTSLFTFELRFSENFPGRFRHRVLRDEALQVTNGRVTQAKRVARGQNQRWTIKVRPASLEDVVVTLPAATDCAATGAVCTEAGRKLSNTVTATVQGPVALSVADARANEADEALAFTVSLSRAARATVTVDYATADGSATAGEDYTAASGTLAFAAGETEKTVSVSILDDAIDEGEETFTLTLANAQGAAIGDGEATGTIENSDPLQKMWLSRFGRTVAGHVVDAVSDRLATPLTGAQVTVGGQSVNLAEADDEAAVTQTLSAIAGLLGAPSGPASGDGPGGFPGSGPPVPASGPAGAGFGLGSPTLDNAPAREISGRELLLGSAFHLAREGDGRAPGLAAWGRVTVGGFDGEAPADNGSVTIDGDVTTGILGADAEWNRLLAGVAVSVSEGKGTLDQPGVDSGKIESTMTAVSPYARFTVNDRISVWGLAGWGTGDMTIVQDARAAADGQPARPERISRTDLAMRLAVVGGRGALLEQDEAGGFDLALKADAFHVETESDPISNEGKTTASASRVRLALEGSRAFQVGGGTLTPGLELGLRHDGGDAETGTGVELGGRVSWTDPETGLSVEAQARTLIAHEDSNYREWGASGAVRLAPGERGRGLSFSLSPTWGAASSGVEGLWSARDAQGLAPGTEFEAEQRLEGELGYGLSVFGDRFTGTPNVGFGLSDTAREYRLGWRLTSAIRNDPGFEVSLDATRTEPANDNGAAPEHGVMLRGAIRW